MPSEDISEKRFADIAVGDAAMFEVMITEEVIREFATFSGDMNPLHVDANYAASTPFQKPIAHGMIVGAFFSRLIGMCLPGKYALYLSQTLTFREPIGIDSMITIHGKVVHKTEAHNVVTVEMIAKEKNSGKILVDGAAIVKLLA